MSRVLAALAASAVTALTACSSVSGPDQALATFERDQRAAAQQAKSLGRLADALILWRSLKTLNPTDPTIELELAALRREIDSRSRAALARGESAYARGEYREGNTWMLRVLALQPGEPTALRQLRERARAVTRAQQRERLMNRAAPD